MSSKEWQRVLELWDDDWQCQASVMCTASDAPGNAHRDELRLCHNGLDTGGRAGNLCAKEKLTEKWSMTGGSMANFAWTYTRVCIKSLQCTHLRIFTVKWCKEMRGYNRCWWFMETSNNNNACILSTDIARERERTGITWAATHTYIHIWLCTSWRVKYENLKM